jgi:hypothetical protein
VAPDETDPKFSILVENARAYARSLRETQPHAARSQEHRDQMLTWAIGLMGAGLASLPGISKQWCGAGSADGTLVWMFAPWVAGILIALLGRVVGEFQREADAAAFIQKIAAVEASIVGERSVDSLAARILDIMNDRDSTIDMHVKSSRRLNRWADGLYYVTHLTFGAGVAAVLWSVRLC